MHDAQYLKICSIFKEQKCARKNYLTIPCNIYRTLQFIAFVTLSDLNKTSNHAVTHTSYKMHENQCVLLKCNIHVRPTNSPFRALQLTALIKSN